MQKKPNTAKKYEFTGLFDVYGRKQIKALRILSGRLESIGYIESSKNLSQIGTCFFEMAQENRTLATGDANNRFKYCAHFISCGTAYFSINGVGRQGTFRYLRS